MDRDRNDDWVECRCGQRHWGLAGAAGLCLVDADSGAVALQLRSERSHQGGTWGIPGGAIQVGEDAATGALREAHEEAAIPASAVAPRASYLLDHTDWSYTTIVADVVGSRPELKPLDAESAELAWVEVDAVADLDLHPAFATAWPHVRALIESHPILVIDAANVVGSRPDGWWRDRPGAARRLLDSLTALGPVPADWFGLTAQRVWPRIDVILEGQANRVAWDQNAAVTVHRAARSGDDAVVDVVRDLATEGVAPITVVTADRGLRARLPSQARFIGPGTLRELLA